MFKVRKSMILVFSLCTCVISILCTVYVMLTLQEIREIQVEIYESSIKCDCSRIVSFQGHYLKKDKTSYYSSLFKSRQSILNEPPANAQMGIREKRATHPINNTEVKDCKSLRRKYRTQCKGKGKRKNKKKKIRRRNKQTANRQSSKSIDSKGNPKINGGIDTFVSNSEKRKGGPQVGNAHQVQEEFKGIKDQIGEARKSSAIKIGYYTCENEDFSGEAPSNNCKNQWDGIICRNYSYWSENVPQTLKFFLPANWNDKVNSPLSQNSNGVFVVQMTGLYMLFFHTAVYTPSDPEDNSQKYNETIAILHYRKGDQQITKLTCVKNTYFSVNVGRYNSNYRACAISGVMYMTQSDTVQVLLLEQNTILNVTPDVTYFGVVLLSRRQ